MKHVVLGALAALACVSGAHAEDLFCKGAAANSSDLMVVQAVIKPGGDAQGGIATLWLGGVRKDIAVSVLIAYDLKGAKATLSAPNRLTVFSRDASSSNAVWAVVTIAGMENRGRWRAQKAPATGGSAEIPGALRPLTAGQDTGVDITISLQDKAGQPIASGKLALPPMATVTASTDRAFSGAATAAAMKNKSLCQPMDGNVNQAEFLRNMHMGDAGMESHANDMRSNPNIPH